MIDQDVAGLEPAAYVRWHEQNGFDVTEFSGLREHPEVEAFWGNRKKLALYTADQVRAAAATERERCTDEIERLRGAMSADDERLRLAGERVGLSFGCDTADAMADEIERLRAALAYAEAALADIGDATREPGDDAAWCEARATKALPHVRAALGPNVGVQRRPQGVRAWLGPALDYVRGENVPERD